MSVKVVRERPSRRRHHRVTAPMHVTCGGHTLAAADWSLGGLRLEQYPGELPQVGAALELHLDLPFQGFVVGFEAKAEVVRNDAATGMFAVQFTELGQRESELMSHFIEELIRGSMVSIDDTIQRIDVPVTPISTKPDPNPKENLPARRWPVKTVVMTSVYATLGFFVFSYAGLLTYSNVFRVEVPTAVISAPIDTIRSQSEGRIVYTNIRQGDRVVEGQIILDIADNNLEKEIDLAEMQIKERQAELAYMKRRQAQELERMAGLATVTRKELGQSEIELGELQMKLDAARNHYNRLADLYAKGHTTQRELEQAQVTMLEVQQQKRKQELELSNRSELANRYLGQRFYTGETLVGDVAELEAQARRLEMQVTIAEQTHARLQDHRKRLAVMAPFDGVVRDLPKPNLSSVRDGDVIAVIEQPDGRAVKAYMRQDEILNIGLGDEALIYIPALGETLTAWVTEIDRTSGFVDEQRGTHTWRGSKDRTAEVSLAFRESGRVANAPEFRSGLPVIVIFQSRSTNQLVHEVKQKLNVLASTSREATLRAGTAFFDLVREFGLRSASAHRRLIGKPAAKELVVPRPAGAPTAVPSRDVDA